MRTLQDRRGFTLLEACIVTAIAAIALTAAIPAFGAFIDKQRLDGAAAELAADLQFTRAEAVLRNTGLRLSTHAAAWGSCYVIHTGGEAQCRCGESGPAECDGDARELKTVQLRADERIVLQGNVTSMRFDPLHGTSTPAGTLKLVAASGRSVHQVVNLMGRVRTCSPLGAGSVTGYRPC
ncbi:MAG TPA: GspH/FimT family pseudopilin [Albitalea sp.]|jgi:type IV fimbrial biogenesis protein FimT|nr:GspH/FimT family pseudopilin [Albitalea sp.]